MSQSEPGPSTAASAQSQEHLLCPAHLSLLTEKSQKPAFPFPLFLRPRAPSCGAPLVSCPVVPSGVPSWTVLSPDSQSQCFQSLLAFLPPLLDGRDAALLFLGEHGSGKSYTLFGTPNDLGVFFRTAEVVLEFFSGRPKRSPRIRVQFRLVGATASPDSPAGHSGDHVDLLSWMDRSDYVKDASGAREYNVESMYALSLCVEEGLRQIGRLVPSSSASSVRGHHIVLSLIVDQRIADRRLTSHLQLVELIPLVGSLGEGAAPSALSPLRSCLRALRLHRSPKPSDLLTSVLFPPTQSVPYLSVVACLCAPAGREEEEEDASPVAEVADPCLLWLQSVLRPPTGHESAASLAGALGLQDRVRALQQDLDLARETLEPMTLVLSQATASLAAMEALLRVSEESASVSQDSLARSVPPSSQSRSTPEKAKKSLTKSLRASPAAGKVRKSPRKASAGSKDHPPSGLKRRVSNTAALPGSARRPVVSETLERGGQADLSKSLRKRQSLSKGRVEKGVAVAVTPPLLRSPSKRKSSNA